jgi:hypothetical protein
MGLRETSIDSPFSFPSSLFVGRDMAQQYKNLLALWSMKIELCDSSSKHPGVTSFVPFRSGFRGAKIILEAASVA